MVQSVIQMLKKGFCGLGKFVMLVPSTYKVCLLIVMLVHCRKMTN
jgi:hypothetical protein